MTGAKSNGGWEGDQNPVMHDFGGGRPGGPGEMRHVAAAGSGRWGEEITTQDLAVGS